jgi:predicted acylesterase/phospholipase RssA
VKTTTALVLSAGGYFGAYHAGAWRAIARHMRPDIVVGASVGALNGWPIAAGCDPEDLVSQWLDREIAGLLQAALGSGLRRAYFDGAPLLARAERLIREYRPIVPYGLVMLQVPTLERKLVRDGEVTARHLAATCSIPLALPPVAIDGRSYVDGGLLEKLPLWAAATMGATRIFAIDALPEGIGWWASAGAFALRGVRPSPAVADGLKVTTIAPSGALGAFHHSVMWSRENIERWIAMGEQDAERAFHLQ